MENTDIVLGQLMFSSERNSKIDEFCKESIYKNIYGFREYYPSTAHWGESLIKHLKYWTNKQKEGTGSSL